MIWFSIQLPIALSVALLEVLIFVNKLIKVVQEYLQYLITMSITDAEAICRHTNVSLLFWDITQRPLYKSPVHYAVSNASLKVNDRIIAFQLPNDKNPKPVLTIYKRVVDHENLPCKSKPCERIDKLFKVIKMRRPNLVIVDMGKDVEGMDLRPLRILCKQVGARLMVHITKITSAARPLFQYCNILTWTGLHFNRQCTIAFVRKNVSAINLTAMPPFNPFISRNTFVLAEGLRQKGFNCTFGNPLRHELVVDVQLAQDITQSILEMVFVTDQPISLISHIKEVASGIVSFETTNLTLLGLSEQDLAEVVGYIDWVFYVVEELIKTRKQITESNPRYSELLEFKLADDIKKEVKCFCNLFIT